MRFNASMQTILFLLFFFELLSLPLDPELSLAVRELENFEEVLKLLTSLEGRFLDQFWEEAPLLLHQVPGVKNNVTMQQIEYIALNSHYNTDYLVQFMDKSHFMPDARFRKDSPISKKVLADGFAHSTLYMNRVCSFGEPYMSVCLDFMRFFLKPCNINVYITKHGVEQSSPVHNDRQDVFVIQFAGYKRWQLYAPPLRWPRDDQIIGKAKGREARELNQPVEVLLAPGSLLYLPRGWLHHANTFAVHENLDEFSIHLTVGIESETHYLTYEGAVLCVAGLLDRATPSNMQIIFTQARETESLRQALPLGFEAVPKKEIAVRLAEEISGLDQVFPHGTVKRSTIDAAIDIFTRANMAVTKQLGACFSRGNKKNLNKDSRYCSSSGMCDPNSLQNPPKISLFAAFRRTSKECQQVYEQSISSMFQQCGIQRA
jgi:hypothetical protein